MMIQRFHIGLLFASLLFACESTENLLGDTGDYENLLNSSSEENQLVPIDGQWSVSNPQSVSDACGVNSYQDVTEMVPSKFAVKNGTLSSFNTDDTSCEIGNGGAFVCKETHIEDTALSGTATLNIKSVMRGTVVATDNMDLGFDVIIKSCDGAGCVFIEMALNFPCPVTLSAVGDI